MPTPSTQQTSASRVSHVSHGYLPDGVLANAAGGGSTLAALRKWREITCAELSEQSGVDLIIIMLAERGSDLMADERAAIAAVLQVDEDLIGG